MFFIFFHFTCKITYRPKCKLLFIEIRISLIYEQIIGWFCEMNIHKSDINAFYKFLLNNDFSLYMNLAYIQFYIYFIKSYYVCIIYFIFITYYHSNVWS